MNDAADTPERYLARLPAPERAALQRLREVIRAALPGATECMSYAMPGFRMPGGKMAAGYAAFSRHLGLYPHSGSVIPRLAAECAGFKTSKSGVLFTPEQPLPDALVHQILALRLAEIG
ncbi:MAG: DUF1801 domain-containing protein [Phaeovulum sp.]|uniref:iron chaperone n=1 Tax=Phaeovulum sp. TaxID=2934796 RepID=UPI002732BC70|nr:DUF1801 domain-containing protein [Phaeovulum sp.]MDP3861442.1 DUF1801 domain-containing protein [Phaeovulum sp.]